MNAVKKIIKIWFSYPYWCVAVLSLLIVVSGHFILSHQSNINSKSNLVSESPTLPVNPSSGWHPVAIGGGGYITGIYTHPLEPDLVYIRTNNAGFFRWQKEEQKWLPITNSLPLANWDYDPYSGGEALAVDPNDPDIVYIAVGKYISELGTIYKSFDRGTTWQKCNLSLPMGGDETKRWAGNRLVVSPMNSNLLLFGSRQDGLWRSLDGGMTWNQVKQLPIDTNNRIGINAIAFDPNIENLVYASVYNDGVYQSDDGGITWWKLKAGPTKVMQLAVATDSRLYATSEDAPQVSQYAEGKWHDITPKMLLPKAFNGLSLHPGNSKKLIVSEGETKNAKIYYSSDRGKSWTSKKFKIKNTVPWLGDEFFSDHPSAIAFDPKNSHRVWMSDWFSLWRTDNIKANPVKWQNYVAGIEQTVALALLAPPEGAILLSGIAEQEGFYHQNLNSYPQKRLGYQASNKILNLSLTGKDYLDKYFQDTYDIAYCIIQPQRLVRVGGQRWRSTYIGATSHDGGLTWQLWEKFPADTMPLRVAISALDPDHFVVINSEAQPLVTSDAGNSWHQVSGLPDGIKGPWNWNQPLAADGLNGDRFYYYDRGKFYRSDNGGLSFQTIGKTLPIADKYVLQTMPTKEGEIWLSLNNQGLYQSQDGGESFSKIESVKTAHLISVGKSLEREIPYSIYLYGTLTNGKSGLFTSLNGGEKWLQISYAESSPRALVEIEASKKMAGLVFAGTDGRGIYYQLRNKKQLSDDLKIEN